MSEFAVTIIGSGSAVPMHGRHPSAQVVQYDDHFFLIDCGEGTQLRFREVGIKPFRIQHILISHLHGDHFFGLPGLLSSYSHLGRTEPLMIHGPKGLLPLLESIFNYTELKIKYPLTIHEHEPLGLKKIITLDAMDVFTFPLKHRIACNGFLFKETKDAIRLDKQKIETLKLGVAEIRALLHNKTIQAGSTTISKSDLELAPLSRLSYAYCSDTAYDAAIPAFIKDVSVLYHETTFKNELSELAKETGHSTTQQACSIATESGAGCLLMGHYSSRYKDLDELSVEAKLFFAKSVLSIEGKRYRIRDLTMINLPGQDLIEP